MNLVKDNSGRLRVNGGRFATRSEISQFALGAIEPDAHIVARQQQQQGMPFEELDFNKSRVNPNLPPLSFNSIYEIQRSYIQLASGVLFNSDVAFRRNRPLQRMMRHDPDVMAPLLQRQLAVAKMPWDIVPEDPADEKQRGQANELKQIIKRALPRRGEMVRHLLDAIWYGPSAINILWDEIEMVGKNAIAPVNWIPIHPDTLAFDHQGGLGLRVGLRYQTNRGEEQGVKTVQGFDSPVHMFNKFERQAVCLHVFQPSGSDYDDVFESAYAFSGRGMRDMCWFMWLLKQTVYQNWTTFVERYGLGIRIGHYPAGNPEGKAAMDQVLRDITGDVSVLVPHDHDEPDSYKLEIHEPPGGGGGVKIFADMVGWIAGSLKEILIGQPTTTEKTNAGIGSDLATRNAETFERINRFDAESLGDSLSREMIWPMSQMNYGHTPYRPRWEFHSEDVDSEQWAKGAKIFIEAGGDVSQRQFRDMIGIEEPQDGEELMQPAFDLAIQGMQGAPGQAPGEKDGKNDQGNENLDAGKMGQQPSAGKGEKVK